MFSKFMQFLSSSKAARHKADRRKAFRAALRCERLEDRKLMAFVSADLTGGVLTYTFDGANDTAFVRQSGAGNTFLSATANGGPIAGSLFTTLSVTSIVVKAGAGDDIINATGVLAATPLTLIGEAGNDNLTGNGGANTIYGDSNTPDATAAVAFVGGDLQSSIATNFVVTATGGGVFYRQTSQNGVSTRGFGVFNPNDSGVQGTRGIDGDGANGNPTETLIVKFANNDLAAISASLTLGVNRNTNNGNDYVVEAFYGNTSVGSVSGGFGANGANFLQTVNLDFGGQLFDKVTIRNAQLTSDAFVLSAASFQTVNENSFGNDTIDGKGGADEVFGGFGDDTFNISAARDAFGDIIRGGFGTDKVVNATGADFVLTDFRTTTALHTQTVFGVENLDASGKTILGRDAGFDGSSNDMDALDFTGIKFSNSNALAVNLRSGNDKYIGGLTGVTVNGGAGNDTMTAGVGGGTLNGEAGADILTGGTAATTLNGGADADTLVSGVGATIFYFNPLETNNAVDSISSFKTGDRIELKWSVYVGASPTPLVLGGQMGSSGTGAASEIRYGIKSSDATVYLPGAGANAFRAFKILNFTRELVLGDFILS
jgi:hypothetical protein